ncbi:MAG: AbrB/MazE/SpoVT family DNA-binding domain-containing protein [Actinomycetota bacterium]|nr:AbrB/MazE/SpoVT family DNA-binding domain-containing protein [Actinomycetota bacterium]
MDIAKVFQNGRSQAVRLPKEYRFEGKEVWIQHFGNGVLLLPLNQPMQMLEAALAEFEAGFQIIREDQIAEVRPEIAGQLSTCSIRTFAST